MEPVSFGVLGASGFALKHTARAIHEAEGARFAALATSDPAKAEPFAAFAPGLTVHGSYDDAARRPGDRGRVHPAAQPPARPVDAAGRRSGQARAVREADRDARGGDRRADRGQGRQRAVRHRGVHDRAPPAVAAGPAPDRRGRDRHPAARGHRADLRRRRRRRQHPQPARDRRGLDLRRRGLHLRVDPVRRTRRAGRGLFSDPAGERRRRLGARGGGDGERGRGVHLHVDDLDPAAHRARMRCSRARTA